MLTVGVFRVEIGHCKYCSLVRTSLLQGKIEATIFQLDKEKAPGPKFFNIFLSRFLADLKRQSIKSMS